MPAYILNQRTFQAAENRRLEDALRSRGPRELPAPPAHWSRPATGSLVGRLEIPRLRLSAIVLEGSDSRTLDLGVGRIPETAEPGESGNVVLSGHRDTFFRPLRGIRTGDRIAMVTRGGSYQYVVDWTAVVDPADTATLKATPVQVSNPGHLLPVPLCGARAATLHRTRAADCARRDPRRERQTKEMEVSPMFSRLLIGATAIVLLGCGRQGTAPRPAETR